MSILKDIFSASKNDDDSQVSEVLVDGQAMTILEQKIREAEKGISKATVNIRNLKAEAIRFEKKSVELADEIDDYTAKAEEALKLENEELALKVAEKIAVLTDEKNDVDTQASDLASQTEKLYKIVKDREASIEKNKIELEKLKTFAQVQKTQAAVAEAMPTNDSGAKRVQHAMDRVKAKHQEAENKMDADQWLDDLEKDSDLQVELDAAGLNKKGTTAKDILAQLKK